MRPTPDRVRETLFNWLGQDLTGLQCLDLFAGSGALGFEAASRGAQRVVMVEHDRAAYAALERNRDSLAAAQVELVRADALEFLRSEAGVYDVIFLDPPFRVPHDDELPLLLQPRLAAGGRVYRESGKRVQWPSGWVTIREGHAGQVAFQLLRWEHDEPHGGVPGDLRPRHERA